MSNYYCQHSCDCCCNICKMRGPTGATGAAGASILGSYNSFEELFAAHPTGTAGDAYLVGGVMYVWNATTRTWQSMGSLIGPTGATGAAGAAGTRGATGAPGTAGATGATGAAGATGVTGVTGVQGPAGANGLAATVSVENSTRIPFDNNPYVINVGTPQNAVLRFGIPVGEPGTKGATGAKGDNGAKGNTGATGATGPASFILPFSISKGGVYLDTDAVGNPYMITFAGFAPAYGGSVYLQAGDWAAKTIHIDENVHYPTSFIMPVNGILKKIYLQYTLENTVTFDLGATVQPFICIAVSDSDAETFKILENTIVYADSYRGGTVYTPHSVHKGAQLTLNEPLKEGTVVGIVAGIKAANVTREQEATFLINGSLYIE